MVKVNSTEFLFEFDMLSVSLEVGFIRKRSSGKRFNKS